MTAKRDFKLQRQRRFLYLNELLTISGWQRLCLLFNDNKCVLSIHKPQVNGTNVLVAKLQGPRSLFQIGQWVGRVARNHARVARVRRGECEGLARRLLNNFVNKSRPRKRVCIHHFIFVFFLHFFYNSSCRKDQFTVLSLKFGSQDFTDPGLLNIRRILSLWFCLHKCM